MGVALGFNREALQDEPFLGGIDKVIYSPEEQASVFEKMFTTAQIVLNSYSGRSDFFEIQQEIISQLAIMYQHLAPQMKDQSFSNEDEWRLIHYRNKKLPLSSDPEVFFRAAKDVVLPFTKIKPQKSAKLPLTKMVVGPGPKGGLVRDALVGLLTKNHYDDVPVELSSVPFRP